jgi:dTDP-4-dehydrorhamnose reductase
VLDLVIDRAEGIWHLTNGEAVSWHGFACRLAVAAGMDPGLVPESDARALGWAAARPPHVPLASTRGALMPSLSSAIERFVRGYHERNPASPEPSLSVLSSKPRAFA